MEKNNECVICLDSLDSLECLTISIETLQCNHKLHSHCIKKLIMSNCPSKYKCPICRYPLHQESIHQDIHQNIRQNIQIPLPLVQAMLFSFPTLIF